MDRRQDLVWYDVEEALITVIDRVEYVGKSAPHSFNALRSDQRSNSEVIFLFARASELVHVPFDIAVFVVGRAHSDLEQAHRHPWSDLGQLD